MHMEGYMYTSMVNQKERKLLNPHLISWRVHGIFTHASSQHPRELIPQTITPASPILLRSTSSYSAYTASADSPRQQISPSAPLQFILQSTPLASPLAPASELLIQYPRPYSTPAHVYLLCSARARHASMFMPSLARNPVSASGLPVSTTAVVARVIARQPHDHRVVADPGEIRGFVHLQPVAGAAESRLCRRGTPCCGRFAWWRGRRTWPGRGPQWHYASYSTQSQAYCVQ